jgi:hypothetical protein
MKPKLLVILAFSFRIPYVKSLTQIIVRSWILDTDSQFQERRHIHHAIHRLLRLHQTRFPSHRHFSFRRMAEYTLVIQPHVSDHSCFERLCQGIHDWRRRLLGGHVCIGRRQRKWQQLRIAIDIQIENKSQACAAGLRGIASPSHISATNST